VAAVDGLAGANGASVALLLVGRALVRPGGDPRPIVVIGLMLQSLLLVAVAVLLGAHQSRPRAPDFGLRRPPLLRAAALSLGLWFAVFAALGNALVTAIALAWTWQVPLAIAFSILATLALARIIATLLGD
jgi:hypothetical protein